MVQEGFEQFKRRNGSTFFICDSCIHFGFITDDEEKIIQHVLEIHGIQQIKQKCPEDFSDDENRRFLPCQLDIGHSGDHKYLETVRWKNKND